MGIRKVSSVAVSEVLKGENYLVWSTQVRTYLIAQDLWDIVEATDECPKPENDESAFKAWTRKNAMALHVIQISCRQEICHVISLITSPKIAWETLEEICSIPESDYVERKESYAAWSNRMKIFLMNHDLWDIVETTTESTTPAWSKKNALALYFITESYDWDFMKKIGKAKIAWDTIAEMNKAKNAWDTVADMKKSKTPWDTVAEMNESIADPDSDFDMPDLRGDNYEDWSLQMKALFRDKQLWDIVEGTDEPPQPENDDAAFMAWSKKNAMALGVIKDSCRRSLKWAIEKISSAKIAWYTLAAICAFPETDFEFLAADGNNYLDWSLKVKAILTDRQLWDVVEGTDDPPKSEKNDMALGLFRYSCRLRWGSTSAKIADEIRNITSAKIAWDALAAICALPKSKLHIDTITDKKSIAAVIERLESIPAVSKRPDDVANYKDWSLQVKTYLTNQQLWEIVEGTNEPPKAENGEAAFMAWSEKNALAFRVIVFSCGYRLRFAIWWITSAKIAWDTLAEICTFPKSSFIVPGEYDYEDWSVRMEDCLKSCNLWDVVEAATEPPKPKDDEIDFNAWSKKNAIALYLIWESSDAFFSFKRSTKTAQIAWDTLAEFGNSGGIKNSELRKYASFRQNLRKGDWSAANQFITSCPEAKSAIITNTGSTALQIAILAGHLHIVKELVNMLETDDLKIKDKDGNTVLGNCALVGNIEMAKCIVEKCPILLGIAHGPNGPHGLIPVVMALMHNSNTKAMAQYLFSKTDLQNLSPGKSVNGATFVTRCIYSKAFDMALYALEKFPSLVTALDIEKESPVLALASMSFA